MGLLIMIQVVWLVPIAWLIGGMYVLLENRQRKVNLAKITAA